MAVYSKLLLSAGGGIVSTEQQAEQVKNTASIIIGLGGTGVHCIRTIKTQVQNRLKADNPDSPIQEYSHIRFIGVDTTMKSKGGDLVQDPTEQSKSCKIASLDDTEFFSIGNKQIAGLLDNPAAFERRKEFGWLDPGKLEAELTDAGAGGTRQLGRLMMMDKSQDFMHKLEQEIRSAMLGLDNPRVNIHIFAGLSGGTGSGCFLDTCYMARAVAESIGGVTIFGYCFLPDVNLSNVPLSAPLVRGFIKKNGYAAMQELDYCMNLKTNGGKFSQEYKGHKIIEWKSAPVDMCHLICATDSANNVIPNAYDYAMNVAAEYIMDFLTNSEEEFGITEHLANFRSLVTEANNGKTYGANMAYCVIGASCASMPLREINTYLATGLFAKFSTISTNVPSRVDVENFARATIGPSAEDINGIYDSLMREVRENASNEYAPYQGDWKDVRDYGNKDMIRNYSNQTAEKKNVIEANTQSLIANGNERSLINRINCLLIDICKDYTRGPIFANGIIDAAYSHNLINIIDGLLAENKGKWDHEYMQKSLRETDAENAWTAFENKCNKHVLNNASKELGTFEFYLMVLEQHRLDLYMYEHIDNLLRTLKSQISDLAASFYEKLSRVLGNLIETFSANASALETMISTKTNDNAFEIPLVTIDEIQETLDAQVEAVNIEGMLSKFMDLLIEQRDEWITEDENRIAKLITNFFVEDAFSGFANKTITTYLWEKYTKKYGTINPDTFVNLIYTEWMRVLTSKARPLFNFNSIISEAEVSKIAHLSFPEISHEIQLAAKKMCDADNTWSLKTSALTDRIFVMCNACGLPLCAYGNCDEYEKEFFATNEGHGRHYYEGKGVRNCKFSDWRKLLSVTPQSRIYFSEGTSDGFKKSVGAARDLYERAFDAKVINESSAICEPDKESFENAKAVCTACREALDGTLDLSQVIELEKKLDSIGEFKMVPTAISMPNDGHRDDEKTIKDIRKDYFVASPCIQIEAKEILDKVKNVQKEIEECKALLAATKEKLSKNATIVKDFCEAIFTGVIVLDNYIVKYTRTDFTQEEITLCQRGNDYPDVDIPVYQAFVNYEKLPDEVRDEINENVNNIYNSGSEKLLANIENVKKNLAPNKLRSYLTLAANKAKKTEICDLITAINKNFEIFCLQNDC